MKRFAGLTGDWALSEPDVNVIALALKLEKKVRWGFESHSDGMAAARNIDASEQDGETASGMGFRVNAEDWKELDEMNAEMERMEKS